MSRLWTKQEVAKLKELVDKKYTKTQLAEYFDRSVAAVVIKVNRLGLQVLNCSDSEGNRGRVWRESDVYLLRELWTDPTVSKTMMQNRLNRSWFSIRKKAAQLELGARDYDTEYLSIPTICEEMSVTSDRVLAWIKLGLKTKKSRSGKVKYLISTDDLLAFLEMHQDMFNATNVSGYLFSDEPDWLKQKRLKDVTEYPVNIRRPYTNDEDKIIVKLYNSGLADKEIAKKLGRTEIGIKYHRYVLGLVNR